MKGTVDLSERWEAERLEDYRRVKAGAGRSPVELAARNYVARTYRRQVAAARRRAADGTLLIALIAAIWLLLVWLAAGWLLGAA